MKFMKAVRFGYCFNLLLFSAGFIGGYILSKYADAGVVYSALRGYFLGVFFSVLDFAGMHLSEKIHPAVAVVVFAGGFFIKAAVLFAAVLAMSSCQGADMLFFSGGFLVSLFAAKSAEIAILMRVK